MTALKTRHRKRRRFGPPECAEAQQRTPPGQAERAARSAERTATIGQSDDIQSDVVQCGMATRRNAPFRAAGLHGELARAGRHRGFCARIATLTAARTSEVVGAARARTWRPPLSDIGAVDDAAQNGRFGTGAAEFPREVAEAALAHAVGDKAEQAYRRSHALERRRKLMEDSTTALTHTTGGSPL
jgi:hypothetical protein